MKTQEIAGAVLDAANALAKLADLLSAQAPAADLSGLAQHESVENPIDEVVSAPKSDVSEDEAKDALTQVVRKKGLPAGVDLLGQFNAVSFSKLDKKHYADFVARAGELVG